MEHNVVICGYKRSPFTQANKGALKTVRADDMAATVVKALVKETGIKPSAIEDLIMGCAFPEGEQGFNIARLVALHAGLPLSVAGQTVNRFCGSSMQAIHAAAGAIQMGAGEAFICAGVESMSRVPMGGYNPMPNPDLFAKLPAAYMGMGETAENLAKKYKIDRVTQEEFAVLSHHKAAKAQAAGKFKEEIVPIAGVKEDGCIRPDTTQAALSTLKPAFDVKGTVTAATSSPLTDGAAAVLVCSETFAKKNKLPILARIVSIAVSACEPHIMGIGPVLATQKALARAGLKLKNMDVVELNEAFAAQSLAVMHEWDDFSPAKINIDGGAIALGHPLGATGARIVGKVASLLNREKATYGLATQCIGGGQGIATILERVK